MTDPVYLTSNEVVTILGIAYLTLYRWRKAGVGPPCRVLCGGNARYERAALLAWIENQPTGAVK